MKESKLKDVSSRSYLAYSGSQCRGSVSERIRRLWPDLNADTVFNLSFCVCEKSQIKHMQEKKPNFFY
jgi:hypothetical protein